jgi:hypothetical protein
LHTALPISGFFRHIGNHLSDSAEPAIKVEPCGQEIVIMKISYPAADAGEPHGIMAGDLHCDSTVIG